MDYKAQFKWYLKMFVVAGGFASLFLIMTIRYGDAWAILCAISFAWVIVTIYDLGYILWDSRLIYV